MRDESLRFRRYAAESLKFKARKVVSGKSIACPAGLTINRCKQLFATLNLKPKTLNIRNIIRKSINLNF